MGQTTGKPLDVASPTLEDENPALKDASPTLKFASPSSTSTSTRDGE
jgi:hypothetical protein